jgi:O-antigen ligase
MTSEIVPGSENPDGFSRQSFLSGWLAFSGLLLPQFGRAFSVLGIHTRLIGFLLLLAAIVVGLRKTKYCRSSVLVLFVMVLYFLLLFIYADPEQIRSLFALSFAPDPYPDTKLSRTLAFNALPVVMGFLLSRVAARSDFRRGVVWSLVTWTLVGLVVGILNSEYWFSPATDSAEAFERLHRYSVIGMTLVLMGGFLTGLVYFLQGRRKALSLSLLLSSFLLIVVHTQRAAWIYCLLAALFLVAQSAVVRPSAGLRAALGAVSAILVGILIANEIGAISVGVLGRAEGIFEGRLFDSRAPLFLAAIRGFWEHPFGQGLASFARAGHGTVYPHNVFLEALYELGLAGGILMAALLIFLLKNTLRLVRGAPQSRPSLIIGLYLGYILIFSLKSGDFTSTELFFSMALLFSCPRPPGLATFGGDSAGLQVPVA